MAVYNEKVGRQYFEGTYYKHQAFGYTLAIIPGRASDCAFIQVITNDSSYYIEYPLSEYHQQKEHLVVGDSVFSLDGVHLDIHTQSLYLLGDLRYESLTPLKSDIMGPFRHLPMQCHHSVASMKHTIAGSIKLNGKTVSFTGGTGYIESDRGRSFPKSYVWVQSNDFKQDCSIMVSVATIPFCGFQFTGCICVVQLNGHQYRLATYNGVKIECCTPERITLCQGKYRLEIKADCNGGHALQAPQSGVMARTIHENAACPAWFRFIEGNSILLDAKSDYTGYEYVGRL